MLITYHTNCSITDGKGNKKQLIIVEKYVENCILMVKNF